MIERLSLEPSDSDTFAYNVVCAGAETGKMLEGVAFHYQRFDAEKIANHAIGGLVVAIVILRLMKKTDDEIGTAFRTSCERWFHAAQTHKRAH